MGLDIYQNAIVGVKLSLEDIKKVISPAIYENRPRYDIRTGEIKEYERVLVKQERSVYAIGPYEFKDQWSIQFKKNNKYELGVSYKSDDFVYIGLTVPDFLGGDTGVDGEFLDGSISLSGLSKIIGEVQGKFIELNLHELIDKVELHFYTYISY